MNKLEGDVCVCLTDLGVEWRDHAMATYSHDVSPKKPAEPGQVGTALANGAVEGRGQGVRDRTGPAWLLELSPLES